MRWSGQAISPLAIMANSRAAAPSNGRTRAASALPAVADGRCYAASRSLRCAASRSVIATMVSVGLALPEVGKTELPAT